jgi:hypothetical protein
MQTNPLKINIKGFRWTLLLVACAGMLRAQSLEDYVHEGMKSNLVLQQKNVSLQQAQQSLNLAKSYFLPTVNLLADYTPAKVVSMRYSCWRFIEPRIRLLNQVTRAMHSTGRKR